MTKTAPQLLAEIREKLRYQATALTCSLGPSDCKAILGLLQELEAAEYLHLTRCIDAERELRMREVHKIALEDNRLMGIEEALKTLTHGAPIEDREKRCVHGTRHGTHCSLCAKGV